MSRPRLAVLSGLLFPALMLAAAGAHAAERPKIGLVLGGGGARGAAHVGVLEVLEQHRVPIACVAGTSFGALVAGAWAAGVSPAEMRRAMDAANWNDMFQDNPDYAELNFRNKRLLQRYLPSSETGIGADGVTYPPGAVTGQKVKLFINQLVRADLGERDIEQLALPLSIVATDIGSGERIVFRSGSLTQAMRASMSVPGLMAPQTIDGRKLVDGGLVDNLPVREVRERCGADVVIAVNVGSPLLAPDDVGSLLSVSAQMVALLTEQNVTLSLARLKAGDIYIKPVLDDITSGDFTRHAEAIEQGRIAAGWAAAALQTLALPDPQWQRWQQARAGDNPLQPWVQAVEIEGLEHADPAVVARHLSQKPDTPLDTAALQRDLGRVFGDGWYESVDYSLLTARDRNILRITPVEKPWGPDYLRFAVNLNSTLSQGATYGLRVAYQKTWLNRLGGELLLSGELGSRTAVEAQWYQPLSAVHEGFGQVDLSASSSDRDLYEGDDRIARYDVYRVAAEFSLGRNLRLLGQLRLGWQVSAARAELDTGVDVLPADTLHARGAVFALDFDRLNRLYFPTDGWAAQLNYFHPHDGAYSRVSADLRGARSFGPWVLGARAAYVGSPRGQLPLSDAATLGGFLNLSAFGANQFVADNVRYAHVRAERIIGRLPLGLRGDMRLGLALEAGRTGTPYTLSLAPDTLDSVTVYLGGETPFGPVYVGLSHATSGDANAYLFLGTP